MAVHAGTARTHTYQTRKTRLEMPLSAFASQTSFACWSPSPLPPQPAPPRLHRCSLQEPPGNKIVHVSVNMRAIYRGKCYARRELAAWLVCGQQTLARPRVRTSSSSSPIVCTKSRSIETSGSQTSVLLKNKERASERTGTSRVIDQAQELRLGVQTIRGCVPLCSS